MQDEECRPAKVLRKLWDNLDAAVAAGDAKSAYFKQNLRVVAAGGDGTVAWILGTIRQVRTIMLSNVNQNRFTNCEHMLCSHGSIALSNGEGWCATPKTLRLLSSCRTHRMWWPLQGTFDQI